MLNNNLALDKGQTQMLVLYIILSYIVIFLKSFK